MRQILRWGFAFLLPAAFLASCASPGPQAVTYTGYYLTCCTQADIEKPWQPGTTVELTWIVESTSRTTVNPSHRAVATAVLTGPYSDVPTLKQASGPGARTVQGSAVAIDDRTPLSTTPVSTFVLPADLPPGYYNLKMKWDFGDGSVVESSSIVRVGMQ